MSVSRRYHVGIASVFWAMKALVDVAFGGGRHEMLRRVQGGWSPCYGSRGVRERARSSDRGPAPFTTITSSRKTQSAR